MAYADPVYHGGKNYPEQVTGEFLCCPICKEPGYKDPRMLLCGHTFCRPCLEQVLSAQGFDVDVGGYCFNCCQCGRAIRMPLGGPCKLSCNIFLDNQVDRLLRRHNKHRCRNDGHTIHNISCYTMDNPLRHATFQ